MPFKEEVRTVDRDKQIELMCNVEERMRGYVQRWLANPEFRAALHRYDRGAVRQGPKRERRLDNGSPKLATNTNPSSQR